MIAAIKVVHECMNNIHFCIIYNDRGLGSNEPDYKGESHQYNNYGTTIN